LKVKELDNGTLVVEGNALQEASNSYQEGRIIEAFSLLHAYIEWEVENLYEQNHIKDGGKLIELGDEMENYRFKPLLKKLLKNKLIKPHEYGSLSDWYHLRNRIIHRLVAYSYFNYQWNRVTSREVEKGFHEGLELAELLKKRVMEI
jgi:hypothetical protein